MPEQPQHIRCTLHHIAPRPVNPLHPGIAQEVIVLRGDDAACEYFDVAATCCTEEADEFGDEGFVASGERRCADGIDFAFERQGKRLLWCLEQRAADRVKSHIAKGRCDDIGPAIMPVLPHFGDEDAGFVADTLCDGLHALHHLRPAFVKFVRAAVNARYGHWGCGIATEDGLHRIRNFAKRGAGAGAFDGKGEKV